MFPKPTAWGGATSVRFPPIARWMAIASLLLAALTVTWTGLKLPGLGDPADILIVAAFGMCALMVAFGDLRFSMPSWSFIPAAAIVACVLARQLDPPPYYLQVLRYQFGINTPNSLVKAIFWLFALLVVPLTIVACIALDRRVAVWVMAAFVTGTAMSSGIAIVDLTGLTNIGRSLPGNLTFLLTNTTVDSSNRIPGLSDHPNNLGFTATLSIPVVVYFMGTMKHRWVATTMLICLLGGILASGSRGAQLVAPVVLIASVLWLPRIRSDGRSNVRFFSGSALAAVVVGLAVLVSLPSKIRESILRITSIDSFFAAGNASNDDRFTLLENGMLDWRQYPIFGAGLRHIVEAHNIYVQLIASGGLVLLIAMFAYWWCMIRDCLRLSAMGVDYARFLMLSIVGWLVLGAVENQLTERGIYFAVGCIAGVASLHLSRRPDSVDGEVDHDALRSQPAER
ncbi:O-antigen ligase [Mycolicibacterium sp. P1-18]|uniref:O-antigen ligase family protein n=1 Tax=Mycolicibacterium sp. P1-18 TaxID=2024615 RepID=UPI0011F393B5|nr:O-antigen ligase family protein [Mycolicibacterium sp. P1-18]